ncbi:hypothetical protein DN412_41265 [Cupriavidus lacunae]|uniref:Uncharacterized protein n=2 Tax=Cupriavidus lacunae TaxID=2666307 RepID=A0A370MY52_9BURK|nr:hypothetical protein DN412_41265 [Cupriavidus lacunae]
MFLMYFLNYLLGIASVILAALVADKPFPVANSSVLYKGLATALSAVTGMVAFINPERIGERYQRAFRVLSVEITRFRGDKK